MQRNNDAIYSAVCRNASSQKHARGGSDIKRPDVLCHGNAQARVRSLGGGLGHPGTLPAQEQYIIALIDEVAVVLRGFSGKQYDAKALCVHGFMEAIPGGAPAQFNLCA